MPVGPSIFHIDPGNTVPLYHQIKENLREAIENEVLRPEDMLPSERELSKLYSVSRLTVRKATEILVQEGLLQRMPGIGTFVAQPKVIQSFPTMLGFSARMRQEGHVTLNRVLAQERVPAQPAAARRLGIAEQAPVMRLVRLRIVDNEPLMLDTSLVPLERFPDLLQDDFAVRSLYDILMLRYKVKIATLDQTLEPVLLSDYEAHLLDSAPGIPAMLMEVVARDREGVPIELSRSVVRGDKCRYYFRLQSAQ